MEKSWIQRWMVREEKGVVMTGDPAAQEKGSVQQRGEGREVKQVR